MVNTFLAVLCIKAKNSNVEGFIAKKYLLTKCTKTYFVNLLPLLRDILF